MKGSSKMFVVAISLLLTTCISSAQNTLDKIAITASTSAGAAYSLRLLSSNYSGFALQVRRASDNATQDIGFTANGDFNTTALQTFAGSSNAFVTIWYYQSGSGRNAVQLTAANQPQIVSAGFVNISNGLPAINFNGGSHFYKQVQLLLG